MKTLQTWIIVLLCSSIFPQQISAQTKSPLTESATNFVTDWLIERKIVTAMQFVSYNPVLGRCSTEAFSKKPSTAKEKRQLIRRILLNIYEEAKGFPDIRQAIKPTGIPATENLKITETDLFQIVQITCNCDFTLICKFDETTAYRSIMNSPKTRFVTFQIQGLPPEAAQWVTAWRYQKGKWRIIEIGILED